MLAVLIYIIGVILVLIGGIIFIVSDSRLDDDEYDLENYSFTVATISLLSWLSILCLGVFLILYIIAKVVEFSLNHLITKKGL